MTVTDFGIYISDSFVGNIFRYHFSQIVGPLQENWSYYTDKQAFNNSSHQRKIACFQLPYPYNDQVGQDINAVYDSADVVIVLGSELHPRTVEFIQNNDRDKICWFICGYMNTHLLKSRTYYFFDWFINTVHFYKNIRPTTLYNLEPYKAKPLMFDALLGRKKPHRDQAYRFINEHNLPSITTYVDDHQINFKSDTQENWIWPEGLTEFENVQWTVDMVRFYGHRMSLSQVIPFNIYNQTAYSLVAETNFDNNYVFFTEKTVKPILARRLFILLSHRYALARLRELGFKTFGDIIDESYDEIEAPIFRHQAALEQMKWLCEQDQQSILDRVQEITEHNFNVMYGTNWYERFSTPLTNVLFNR